MKNADGNGREDGKREHKPDYVTRMNRVIDHIDAHLDERLDLESLARIAGLSRFHFHRTFHSLRGESLHVFITRLRVERAAGLLLSASGNITETALHCGFNDAATFARAFKKRFGVSASEWKRHGPARNSKIHQDSDMKQCYDQHRKSKDPILPVSIRDRLLPTMNIAYIRYTGPFAGDSRLFARLHSQLAFHARRAGFTDELLRNSTWLIVYHDPIGITEEKSLRLSFGLVVPHAIPLSGEVGWLQIPAGRYAISRFALESNEYEDAWAAAYSALMARGILPADAPSFEMYGPGCYNGEQARTIVDICIPMGTVGQAGFSKGTTRKR